MYIILQEDLCSSVFHKGSKQVTATGLNFDCRDVKIRNRLIVLIKLLQNISIMIWTETGK